MTEFAQAELRYERAMRRLMGVVGLVLAAVVVASGVTLWTILDCTRPGWACYERGQRAGGEFMRMLINDSRVIHNYDPDGDGVVDTLPPAAPTKEKP